MREKEELSWESDEDEGLIDPELEDETRYGNESEYGADVDTDEDEEEGSKPAAEPVILPCRTLSQLWKAEIHEFNANDRVGFFEGTRAVISGYRANAALHGLGISAVDKIVDGQNFPNSFGPLQKEGLLRPPKDIDFLLLGVLGKLVLLP